MNLWQKKMNQNSTEQKPTPPRRRSTWLVAGLVGGLVLVCLAGGLAIIIGIRERATPGGVDALPPTATRAPGEAEVAVIRETLAPTSTPTPAPTATVTPTPPGSTPVAVEPAGDWTFEGVRIQPDLGLGDLTVYGEAINNSDVPQRILGLQSALYDSQGQAIIPKETSDYWPIETVPPGGRMPFELTVTGPTEADRVELQIATETGDQPPRLDFELTELEGIQTESEYCVKGSVRNLGQPLDSYLMVVAVLYDDDDRVINWGIGYQPASADLVGDETVAVSACAERFNQIVARYELRAWGL